MRKQCFNCEHHDKQATYCPKNWHADRMERKYPKGNWCRNWEPKKDSEAVNGKN